MSALEETLRVIANKHDYNSLGSEYWFNEARQLKRLIPGMNQLKAYNTIDRFMFKRFAEVIGGSKIEIAINMPELTSSISTLYQMDIGNETMTLNLNLVSGDIIMVDRMIMGYNSMVDFRLLNHCYDAIKKDVVYFKQTLLDRPMELFSRSEAWLHSLGFKKMDG